MRSIKWTKWEDPFDNVSYDTSEDTLQVPCAVTSLGVMPINEGHKPGSLFKVWVGHTNFSITETVAAQISQEDGVEGLDVLSRYRFRLIVGEHFADAAVKKSIEVSLCGDAENRGLNPVLSFLRNAPGHVQWGLVKLQTGKTYFYHHQDMRMVELWLTRFSDVASPKRVYVSWRSFSDG